MIANNHNVARYITKLSNKIRWRVDELALDRKLSSTQRRVLAFLLLETQYRDVFQKDIEREYCIRPASATTLLQHMEQNGLITRVNTPYDGRLKKIIVTEKGQSYQNDISQGLSKLESDLKSEISPDDMQTFYRVIEKMLDNIS